MRFLFFPKRSKSKPEKRARVSPYRKHKEAARLIIHERLRYWAPYCGVTYKLVAIRDTRGSWGSCSERGNLNFSYKLLFLSPCLRDYIIVHELCHRIELNHSERFWKEVERVLPDYRSRRRALRQLEKTLGTGQETLRTHAAHPVCSVHEHVDVAPNSAILRSV